MELVLGKKETILSCLVELTTRQKEESYFWMKRVVPE